MRYKLLFEQPDKGKKGGRVEAAPNPAPESAQNIVPTDEQIAATVHAMESESNGPRPVAELFETIHFEPVEGREITGDDGRKSRKVANAVVTLYGGRITTTGSIYARREKGASKVTVEFSFAGTMTRTAIFKALDAGAAEELTEWRKAAARAYLAWRANQPKASKGKTTDVPSSALVMDDAAGLFSE